MFGQCQVAGSPTDIARQHPLDGAPLSGKAPLRSSQVTGIQKLGLRNAHSANQEKVEGKFGKYHT
jgi:hypothetical protein